MRGGDAMIFTRFIEQNGLDGAEQISVFEAEHLRGRLTAAREILHALIGSAPEVVFSNQKYFHRSSVLSSPRNNRRGLHVFRVVFANYAARRVLPEYLLDHGLLLFSNVFSDPIGVARELKTIPVQREAKHPANILNRLGDGYAASQACQAEIRKLIMGQYSGSIPEVSKLINQNSFVQRLVNSPDDDDVQKIAHSDTFFPALKWWYFPEAVEDGCFVYARRSPRLTESLLDFHYRESIKISEFSQEPWRGVGHVGGSLRISDEELAAMGLELEPVTVPANSLVIANVFGFHRRGDTKETRERVSIHGSIRLSKPFSI